MSTEITIFSPLAIAAIAAAVAGITLLLNRVYYRQVIGEKTDALADCQRSCQEQLSKLDSLEQLQQQCNAFVTTVALREQEIANQKTMLAELKSEKERLTAKLHAANHKAVTLEADIREQQAVLTAEQEKLVAVKTQFEEQKNALKNEFKVISEEIIKERQQVLNEQNKEGVGALLKPLQAQIVSFQQRVNEVHTETVKGNVSLEGEIKKVMDIGLKMRDDASNLTSALKGNSQQRGAWGEAQLERTLEMSGLIEQAHYEKQSSFKDRHGRQKQTDYLVKLPGNRHIIIDSKVSLIAYERAVAAATDGERAVAMSEHVKAVKKHIDDLSIKDYNSLASLHSPDFVLMFMPVEPAYIEALKHSQELFGYGYNKHIVLVSHTTLIPILRTVANLWMLEQSNSEAREIGEKAGDIYNSVCTVAERLQKLGNTLNTASTHYNQAVTAISGRQGLQGKVERFAQLSSKTSKTMPALNPRHPDHETSQLEIQPLVIAKTEESAQGSDEEKH